ncbi:MAG: iron-containing alcohol dehydrogenase [Pseudomonadota bacterium]|nr:iron-containing alcohol dehydrogenase [Pseudomonadota bacterium]
MDIDHQTLRGDWNYPTAMCFGPGRISELADACRALDMTRPLLSTDPGLKELPMVRDAIAANEAAGLPTALFADIKGNPVGRNVTDGVAAYKDAGCDGVIAFGGGSGLDAAKAISLMVGQNRPIWDFEDREDWWTRVDESGIAPIVAVPTTAGTGSEVGRASVITDEDTHLKKIIFHPKMLPAIVISDPELTLGLPRNITAWTGMDALAHCLEAYCAPGYHPMAHGIALEGMRLVREWLPVAVEDGANLEARAHMLVAATMGATAFQKGLGAIHAMSHPIGAVHDKHHGLTNAVVMPYVLEFNRPAIEDRLIALARYLDLADASFNAVVTWVLELRTAFDIGHTLADLGIGPEHIDELVPMAAIDPSCDSNPIPIGEPDLRRMFVKSVYGELG